MLPLALLGALAAGTAVLSLRGFQEASDAVMGLLVLFMLALAAFNGGGRALRALLPRPPGFGEEAVIGTTLGLGLLALGAFALAAAGKLSIRWVGALGGGLQIAGARVAQEALGRLRDAPRPGRPAAFLGLFVLLLGLLWLCSVPPHQYDSLVYHLTLPETYLRDGGFSAPRHLLYAHFPQNGEMLFALSLAFNDDLSAQGLMWLSTVLTLGWVWLWGRRALGDGPAWLACGLLATHTSVMLLASITYVEALALLWITAAVLSWWSWREGRGEAWLRLAAIFCGLALGAKYNAGIAAAILAAATWQAAPGRRGLRDALVFTATVTAIFAPWLIKNWHFVGNPFFPFLYKLFPLTAAGWSADTAEGYFRVFTEYGHRGNFLADLLTLPLQILRDHSRFGGGMDALGSLGWAPLVLAAPLGAALAARSNPFLGFLSAYCGLHVLAWFSTGVVLRFLTAAAGPMALLAAGGLAEAWRRTGSAARPALGAGLAALTLLNLGWFAFVHEVFQSGSVLLGRETREAFLSRRLDYHACASAARARVGRNGRILVAGDQRAYGIGRDHAASTIHAPNRFAELANAAAAPGELAAALRGEGFTHVLFVPREFERLKTSWGLAPAGLRAWEALMKETPWIFAARGCALLRLDSGDAR